MCLVSAFRHHRFKASHGSTASGASEPTSISLSEDHQNPCINTKPEPLHFLLTSNPLSATQQSQRPVSCIVELFLKTIALFLTGLACRNRRTPHTEQFTASGFGGWGLPSFGDHAEGSFCYHSVEQDRFFFQDFQ